MSYTRAMPNIKPYPHQDHYDMSYHRQQLPQQQHHSVYRPAYHRIPSTPAVTPRVSNWVSSMTPEVSPIVVPSMSPAPLEFYSNYYYQQQYYRQPVVPSTNVSISQIRQFYFISNHLRFPFILKTDSITNKAHRFLFTILWKIPSLPMIQPLKKTCKKN